MQTRIGLVTAKQLIATCLFAYSEGKEAPEQLKLCVQLAKHYKLTEALGLLERASR